MENLTVKHKAIPAIAALIIAAIAANPARADRPDHDYWLPIGATLTQAGQPFDHIQLKISIGYGDGFNTPTAFTYHVDPLPPSWQQTYNDGDLLVAQGDPTDDISFRLYFADHAEYIWHIQTYHAGELVGNWDGSKEAGGWWNTPPGPLQPGTWEQDQPLPPTNDLHPPIPEPAALTLLGTALLALRRKRR